MLGLPGTNIESRMENYCWFKKFYEAKLFDFSFPKFFVPYPGTDVFENPEEFNVQITHMNWEAYHRWALPRPILLKGVTDRDLLEEVEALYKIME